MTARLVVSAAVATAVVLAAAALRPGSEPRGIAQTRRHRERRQRRVLLIVVLGASGLVLGPVPCASVVGATWAVIRLRRRRRSAAARRAIEEAMPDATELLVACLHAGRSPTQAVLELVRLAPIAVRPAFAAVEHRLHRGHGLADALDELTRYCGRCALPLVTAIGAAVRDGLPLAPVLDRLSDDANASRRRHGEAAARRLPVRLSFPLVVCTLPSFVLLSVAPAVLGAISSLRDSPL